MLKLDPGKRRRAFTLAEVLIVIAILAAIAAVTIPTIRTRMRTAHADAIAGELGTLSQSILNYRQNVGRYPSLLSYLTFLPTSGVADPCGAAYSATNYNNWRGPYVARNITGPYLIADDDTVDVSLYRNPASQNNTVTNYLQIKIYGVDSLMAEELDIDFDGVRGPSAGNITWIKTSAPGQAPAVTLTYQMPIRGC